MSHLQTEDGGKKPEEMQKQGSFGYFHPNMQIPATMFQQPYLRMPTADQQKWLENQQKHRNFQQQRERLREISSTPVHNINTETMIQNMIGKLDKPKPVQQIYSHGQANFKINHAVKFTDSQGLFVKPIALTIWKDVPDAYRIVESAVTRNGVIDIQLLYPVLMSSGLSRETLGYIWSLANCKTPGYLNQDELHIMLSLIAIAQNGRTFSSLEILQSFPQPPIPRLDLGLKYPIPVTPAVLTLNVGDDDFNEFQSASFVPQSEKMEPTTKTVGSRLANYNTNLKLLENPIKLPENPIAQTGGEINAEDEFTDFQQATLKETVRGPPSVATPSPIVEIDLMSSQEDKYSVFRQLETRVETKPEFGDFLSISKPIEEPVSQSFPSAPVARAAFTPIEDISNELLDFDLNTPEEFGDFISYPVGGSASVECQSVSSLEMALWDMLSVNGSKSSPRADSVPSLELKISDDDTEPEFISVPPKDAEIKLSLPLESITPTLVDKYSLFGSDVSPLDTDTPLSHWQRCLESCCELVSNAVNIFSNIMNTKVCEEVIQSEEGSQFVENMVEVYRVACRVTTSVANCGLLQDDTSKIISELRLEWKKLSRYFFHNTPPPVSLDLRCSGQALDSDRIGVACGVCLLDVESNPDETSTHKLSYGGRQYHTTCANFWINCVDSLLPAVPFPRQI